MNYNYKSAAGLVEPSNGYVSSNENVLVTTSYTPVIQGYHLYGLPQHSQIFDAFVQGGATLTTVDGALNKLSISNALYDYVLIRSKRVIKYRSGYTCLARGLFQFSPSQAVPNSLQFFGVGNAQCDLYFCYTGTQFGVRYSTGGQLQMVSLQIVTAASASGTATITLNSVNYTVSVTNASGILNFTATQISKGNFGGLWNAYNIGAFVYFIAASVGPRTGTYAFSSTSGTGTIISQRTGASLTTVFTPIEQCNGEYKNFNTSVSQMYQIEYSWYGSGSFQFSVYDGEKYRKVHQYTFTHVQGVSLTSPNMYLQSGVASLGSTSAIDCFESGVSAFVLGNINYSIAPKSAVSAPVVTIPANVETVVLTLRKKNQINYYATQSELILQSIAIAVSGTKPVVIKMIRNPTTLGAGLTTDFEGYSDISNEQITVYSTRVRSYTGGSVLYFNTLGKEGSVNEFLLDRSIYIDRNEKIIITALSTNTSDVNISVNIIEDY